MSQLQKQVFLENESDSWFERNLSFIQSFDGNQDAICAMIERYSLKPKRILEIGCSAGYRLAHLKTRFPSAEVRGVEPSKRAVDYGKERLGLKKEEILQGTADDLSMLGDKKFDLILAAFFYYVVDRELLMTISSNIDRLLNNNGILIINDFFAARPNRRAYHHIKDKEMYSFKQNYENIFTSTALYHLIAKDSLHHAGKSYSADSNFDDQQQVTMLHKDIRQGYE